MLHAVSPKTRTRFDLLKQHELLTKKQCWFCPSSNLSNNKISEIEDGAFDGATSVVEIHLTANHLESVRGSMFKGMEGLRML